MENNFFFDLIPLVAFFSVYYFTKNIFYATGVCIVATWLQVALCKLKYKKINKNTWLSAILITVFGGLTIIFHNKTFVMVKPTVLFSIVGISILVAQYTGKNGLKLLLEKEFKTTDGVWRKLNISWGVFFIFLGLLNLFVALNFSESTWVKFKVFGATMLTIVYLIITLLIIIISQKKIK